MWQRSDLSRQEVENRVCHQHLFDVNSVPGREPGSGILFSEVLTDNLSGLSVKAENLLRMLEPGLQLHSNTISLRQM